MRNCGIHSNHPSHANRASLGRWQPTALNVILFARSSTLISHHHHVTTYPLPVCLLSYLATPCPLAVLVESRG